MTWALCTMLACGIVLGFFANPLIEAIRVSMIERAQNRAERRKRMGFTDLTEDEARAWKAIERGYKQTAKEDR